MQTSDKRSGEFCLLMRSLMLHMQTVVSAAWRVRSSQVVLLFSVFSIVAAWVGGSFSPRQPQTVMFDVGFSMIRLLSAALAIYWVQELFAKDIERKTVFWICAAPVPRSSYLLGRFLGLIVMLFLALFVMALTLYGGLYTVAPTYIQASPVHLGWNVVTVFLYLWFDLVVVTAFALLLSVLSTTSMLPFFAGIAFVVIARSLGPTLAYLQAQVGQNGFAKTLNYVQWLLPDLSRFDIRDVVLYNKWPATEFLLALALQSLCFVAILMAIASLVFKRREFQ